MSSCLDDELGCCYQDLVVSVNSNFEGIFLNFYRYTYIEMESVAVESGHGAM